MLGLLMDLISDLTYTSSIRASISRDAGHEGVAIAEFFEPAITPITAVDGRSFARTAGAIWSFVILRHPFLRHLPAEFIANDSPFW